MRHGWKTRIEERRYFEEKKEQREERQYLLAKMEEELAIEWEKIKKGSMWNAIN
jgi:hypothetical protein